ncbi:flavin-binding monooxygenase-like protein [Isoptericola sp. CG 20/1183]|uniref:Flavin-binding monooxygenase-like protein n=1 Tax=Isoptericola halotolerans TaxID=300560 RepID=A0ABX5EA39_9MICO|nr:MULTISPECIES: NAD(P)/FAD-dependent oxidoreductase [Isoptericola]PRZ03418.1 flavin-binding monooxygenase-like protein [Isoptericola sp. CG 20/1183]PRZ03705.1 flavin-binding monooxygenase-like protein [Isoptericola halotolerans]
MALQRRVAVIGAGPSGLAAARALDRAGLDLVGYEAHDDVGGLWDIDNPRSTVYDSAHLISSRTTTQFDELPMDSSADYPGHRELLRYFRTYADVFDLRRHYRFGTRVVAVEPADDDASGASGWHVHSTGPDGATTVEHVGHVVIANGTLAEPNVPTFDGDLTAELLHSSEYRSADVFAGKRVLVVGGGNSGCDIAVDAVHRAASVDLSVRRGYWFVPRYLLGRPTDTLNQGRPLPAKIKQAVDSRVLMLLNGDPQRFGFPAPDHKIYESHPVVNSLVLQHAGQGDLKVRQDIRRFDGDTVDFVDGTTGTYDLVLLATGYRLDYPFVDPKHLAWDGPGSGGAPELFCNIVPPSFNGLFVVGMLEASGIGWQGRAEQAELVARLLAAQAAADDGDVAARERVEAFRRRVAGRWPDLTGGYRYLGLERMSYYVNKDAYRRTVRGYVRDLTAPESGDRR